ncbi:antitermination protein NusB [Thermosipho melanesiensis]|nr:antitermination protein NusB [Thermosipho melanesiensis]OOC39076.1 antitermination protein NusB [Thermosipho melanesiensis]OOC39224.1 antitermination protein NusB [Thermosipho melanesiensis]OOC41751.1 antitermination protein NusB [Thermosipho melanesiensis]OOC44366.1 antitermination protein NusB [Thermosipho melanesiensis]
MREAIFKSLFQWDFNKEEILEEISKEHIVSLEPNLQELAVNYLKGIRENIDVIDEIISKYLKNWTLERLSVTDRNILRLGTYELIYVDDIPIEVTLDEMIELGKTYGTENSGKFVNGVLDKIAKAEAPKEKFEL